MRVAWLCLLLYTLVLCPVTESKERSPRHQNGRLKLWHKIQSRLNSHRKKRIAKKHQPELSSPSAPVNHGHVFRSNHRFKHRKKLVNAKGSPKEVIVKVNGQNVYSSDPQRRNSTNGTTPTSPIPVTTPAPQTHNINLHINLTKASNPSEEESNRPIIVAAPPKPQPVVALVPSIASQPAMAPAIVPQVQPPAPPHVPPATTAPPEKKGESSLSKILLTAALLKSLTGSDSSEGYPSALQNLLMSNNSPLSALLAQGGWPPLGYPQAASQPMGYPQLGYPQTGFPALGNPALGYPAAGTNMGYPTVGANMGYPAVGANLRPPAVGANMGYPAAGTNMGYPAAGANMGYPAAGPNTGYPAVGTNMGYPGVGANIGTPAVVTNMGYPALGTNMGYPAGGNPNLRYPATSNQNMGYPAGSYQPAGWNPNLRYGDNGKGQIGDLAGGSQNMGYPERGTQNMAYPGGGSQSMDAAAPTVPNFLSALSPTPSTNLLQNPSASSGDENPPFPGPQVLPNLRPIGSPGTVPGPGLTQSQSAVPLSAPTPQVQPIAAPAGTPGIVPGIGQAQGQGQGQSQGQGQGVSTGLPASTLTVPSTSTGVPGIDPMSSCWCGCEADCPHPCDLCNTSTDNYYNYNTNNNNGNPNIEGTVYPSNAG